MPTIIPYSWVTKSLTETPQSDRGYDTSVSGTQANIYDGDIGTYRMFRVHSGGDGWVKGYQTLECTWAPSLPISSIYAYAQQGTYGGNYKQSIRLFEVDLKINGTWTSIDSSQTTDSQGSNVFYTQTYERTLNAGWKNVTGARLYLYGFAYSYEGDRQQIVQLYMNEFQVNANLNSGLAYII